MPLPPNPGTLRAQEIEPDTEVAVERILRLDDTCLDHDLTGTRIDRPDELADLFEFARDVIDEQDVRLRIGHGIAALAQQALRRRAAGDSNPGQQAGDIDGLLVIQRRTARSGSARVR